MPRKSFRFELYSIHAHLDDTPVDYDKLINALAPLKDFHQEDGSYHTVVGTVNLRGNQLFLVIYTGYSEKSTLFFDFVTNAEFAEATQPGRFQARKTHAMLDARRRLLVIEVRRGGLGSLGLASLIEQYLQRNQEFRSLELEFNPIADADSRRIDELRRIQAATVSLARPNVDWTDRHDQLMEVASESEAGALDVTARARRGKSLSKHGGLVEFIKQGASSAKSMFRKIKIVGTIGDDSGLITLNLSKHVQHLNVMLDTDAPTGLPNEREVQSKLSNYLSEQAPNRDGT